MIRRNLKRNEAVETVLPPNHSAIMEELEIEKYKARIKAEKRKKFLKYGSIILLFLLINNFRVSYMHIHFKNNNPDMFTNEFATKLCIEDMTKNWKMEKELLVESDPLRKKEFGFMALEVNHNFLFDKWFLSGFSVSPYNVKIRIYEAPDKTKKAGTVRCSVVHRMGSTSRPLGLHYLSLSLD